MHVELKQGTITLDLLNQACSFWAKRHPLLQAKIQRHFSEDMKFLYNGDDRYFVRMPAEEVFSFKNVDFIHTNDEDKWKALIENELKTPFDCINGPLWRLRVVKVKENDRKYTFLFMFNHTITDGKNNVIFIELLNIIGSLIEGKECIAMSEVIETPYGMDHYVNEYAEKENIIGKRKDYGIDNINRIPSSLGNKVNGNEIKFDFFKIECSLLNKLKAKMKQNTDGCKLTGLIETICCFSYKTLLLKYGENLLAELPFQYTVTCSPRNKLKIKSTQMGCYICAASVRMKISLDLESIWVTAEQQTKALHEYLEKNEEIAKYRNYTQTVRAEKIPVSDLISGTIRENGISNFLVISNIGVLENAKSDIIKATEFYATVPTFYKNGSGHLFLRINTLEDLFLSISYNEQIYKNEFMIELKQSILELIHKLAE